MLLVLLPTRPDRNARVLAPKALLARSGRSRNALQFPEEDHCNVRIMGRVAFKWKAPISGNLQNFLGAGDRSFRAQGLAPRRGVGGRVNCSRSALDGLKGQSSHKGSIAGRSAALNEINSLRVPKCCAEMLG